MELFSYWVIWKQTDEKNFNESNVVARGRNGYEVYWICVQKTINKCFFTHDFVLVNTWHSLHGRQKEFLDWVVLDNIIGTIDEIQAWCFNEGLLDRYTVHRTWRTSSNLCRKKVRKNEKGVIISWRFIRLQIWVWNVKLSFHGEYCNACSVWETGGRCLERYRNDTTVLMVKESVRERRKYGIYRK